MKRISTLIVLLGLVLGAMLSGCSQDASKDNTTGTNAPPAATPSTNK